MAEPDGPRTEPPAKARPGDTGPARRRLAIAQAALLTALTAGGPLPDGFDRSRMRIQREALAAKRAGVIAKVEPELPRILGRDYRRLALAHARGGPLTGGYREDAAALARRALAEGGLDQPRARHLAAWLRERDRPVRTRRPARPGLPWNRKER